MERRQQGISESRAICFGLFVERSYIPTCHKGYKSLFSSHIVTCLEGKRQGSISTPSADASQCNPLSSSSPTRAKFQDIAILMPIWTKADGQLASRCTAHEVVPSRVFQI